MTRCSTAGPYQLFSQIKRAWRSVKRPASFFHRIQRRSGFMFLSLYVPKHTEKSMQRQRVEGHLGAGLPIDHVVMATQARMGTGTPSPPRDKTPRPPTPRSLSPVILSSALIPPLSLSFNNRYSLK